MGAAVRDTAPCAACGKPLDPRTVGDTHRGCKSSGSVAVANALPPRPLALDTCRWPLTGSAVAAAGASLAHLYVPGAPVGQYALTAVGLAVLGPAAHVARLARWERQRQAQVLWERLAKVTGDPPEARRDHLTVRSYQHQVPVEVKVRPGSGFDPADLPRLRAALAASAGVEEHQVVADRLRGGYRLRVDETLERPLAPVVPMQLVPALESAASAEQPEAAEAVHARILEALRAVMENDQVEVHVDSWGANVPIELTLTYPPRVAPRALECRAALTDTMRALHRPSGDWFIHLDSERDRFLIADRPDPLAPLVPLPTIDQDLDCAVGPILGVGEDGQAWRQPLLGGHVLVAGASGSGKGSVLWGIVRGLSALIADGRARLWVIDPKGGMEFGAARGFAHRFAVDEDEILELLKDAVEQMQANARGLADSRSRKVTQPTVERPLNVVLVDEIASVTAYMSDTRKKNDASALLSKLLSQGRAGGYVVVGALQDPRAEVLKVRNLFTYAVALQLNEAPQVDMVLGRGVRARGAVCDAIPKKTMAGTGFVVADGVAEPRRVRAAFVSDEEIDRLAERLGGLPTSV